MDIKKYKNLRKPGVVTTNFGDRTKDERFHPGVDIANRTGTPIQSLADGQVTEIGPKNNGLGNMITLRDDKGEIHQYSHLNNFKVRPGQRVKRGQNIATMGSSGNSYSPSGGDPSHLDIRIVDAYGRWKDPLYYF